VREVERLFNNYQYGEAGRQIYEFLWNEFADWYVEIAKIQLDQGGDRAYYTAYTLARVYDLTLRLLHPFIPFVTEELWGHLKEAAQAHSEALAPAGGWEEALIISAWPDSRPEEDWETAKVTDFNLVQELVRAIRNLRAEYSVDAGRRLPAILVSAAAHDVLIDQIETITALARLDRDKAEVQKSITEKPEGHIALVVGPVEIFLPLAGLVDLEEERERLQKELSETESQIQRLEELLASEFSQKAPPPVVQKERDRLEDYRQTAVKLRRQLQEID